MNLSTELESRGFIHQFSAATIQEIVDGEKRTIYHGIDPTADSIHVGNFVAFMLLRHFIDNGHKVVLLIGGGTGMIGDPKPDVERPLTPPEVIVERVRKIRAQAERLLGTEDIVFVNNHEWLGKLNLIDFLRETGKHFTVNELIKKDAIASRLTSETGLSYTEFAYPLLQAFDYLTLHKEYNCDLQVGGSDQWGNIVAGVDLVRKKTGHTVYALTTPLVTDKATGKKFGKSEGNAVWLDPEKTSPYEFYQFWLNVSDESVVDYLKLFTLLSLDEIAELEQKTQQDPGDRLAQKTLAATVTKMVHGQSNTTAVINVSEILFGSSSLETLTREEKEILLTNAPVVEITKDISIVDVLVEANLAASKREARMFVESEAVIVNDQKINGVDTIVTTKHYIDDVVLLRRGKKQFTVLHRTK